MVANLVDQDVRDQVRKPDVTALAPFIEDRAPIQEDS